MKWYLHLERGKYFADYDKKNDLLIKYYIETIEWRKKTSESLSL